MRNLSVKLTKRSRRYFLKRHNLLNWIPRVKYRNGIHFVVMCDENGNEVDAWDMVKKYAV